jgi:hypothetical protein
MSITTTDLKNLNVFTVANAANMDFDYVDGPGGQFITTTLATAAEHTDSAEDPVEALRYFIHADAWEVAAEFDLPDFVHAVADAVASRLVYNIDVAETWVALCGWNVEDEVNDLVGTEALDVIGRMRLGLYVMAQNLVWAARGVVREALLGEEAA